MPKRVTLLLSYVVGEYADNEAISKQAADWKDILQQAEGLIDDLNIVDVNIENLSIGAGYYFCLVPAGDYDGYENTFLVVSKQYWAEHHHLDGGTEPALPAGFWECEESTYRYDGTVAAGRQRLLDFGFTELPEMYTEFY